MKSTFLAHAHAVLAASAVSAFLLWPAPDAGAIQWCHDYTRLMATGEDHNGTSPKDLSRVANRGGYTPYSVGNMTPRQVEQRLRPGDIIIFGDGAHSGYVNKDGTISHYLQPSGLRTTRKTPDEIKNLPNFHPSQSYGEIWNTHHTRNPVSGAPMDARPYKDRTTILWRPPPDRDKNRGDATAGAARDTARDATRDTVRDATRTAVTDTTKDSVKDTTKDTTKTTTKDTVKGATRHGGTRAGHSHDAAGRDISRSHR